VITLKRYTSSKGGPYFVEQGNGSTRYGQDDIYAAIRVGENITFIDLDDTKEIFKVINWVEVPKEKGGKTFLRLKQGDTGLAKRIFDQGGLIAYALKLEKLLEMTK
jgi:hypothetical protein